MTSLVIDAINLDISFKNEVEHYSNGNFTIETRNQTLPIHVAKGVLQEFDAYKIADQINYAGSYLFIAYPGNPTSTFLETYYYPQRRCTITTVPLPTDPKLLAFELSHALQQTANENGANPPVQIIDSNFPSEVLMQAKYTSVIPFVDLLTPMKLTIRDIIRLQTLEGYLDPVGQNYWAGHSLDEYLTARIADKVKQLESVQ